MIAMTPSNIVYYIKVKETMPSTKISARKDHSSEWSSQELTNKTWISDELCRCNHTRNNQLRSFWNPEIILAYYCQTRPAQDVINAFQFEYFQIPFFCWHTHSIHSMKKIIKKSLPQ